VFYIKNKWCIGALDIGACSVQLFKKLLFYPFYIKNKWCIGALDIGACSVQLLKKLLFYPFYIKKTYIKFLESHQINYA